MANPQVIVEFLAKTDQLRKGLGAAESSTQSTGDRLKSLGKTALKVAGAAGLGVLVATLHAGIEEASSAAKATAQTEQVIKSTGGAARVTAKHVDALATALMNKSGVDDEAIKSGENLLLTFTNIRNAAGRGNDIFDQATKATLDLSVALGQDMKTSAIQVGKALNDPVKGMTALQRVGVSFTAAQKDQVKALVKSGKTMDAQKLILKELNKEFGGSAEAAGKTMPGQLNILKENFNNLAGQLVESVLPALKVFTDFMVKNPALVRVLTYAIIAVAAAMVAMNVAMAITAAISAPLTLTILAIIAAVVALAAAAYLIVDNWGAIAGFFSDLWDGIKAGVDAILGWIGDHWPLIVEILLGPFGLITVEMVKHWDEIKGAVSDGINAVTGAISDAINWILGWVGDHWPLIVGLMLGPFAGLVAGVIQNWDAVKGAVVDGVNAIGDLLGGAASSIWNAAWGFGHQLVLGMISAVTGIGQSIWGIINNVFDWIYNAFSGIWQAAWGFGHQLVLGLLSAVTGIGASVWEIVNNIFDWLYNAMGGIWQAGWNFSTNLVKGILAALSGIGSKTWDALSYIGSWIANKLGEVWQWGWNLGRKIWDGIGAALRGIGSWLMGAIKAPINAVIGAWNKLRIGSFTINMPGPIPDVHFGGVDLPNLPYLARGGIVTRPTLAMIGEAGPEAVVPLSSSGAVEVHVYIGDQELAHMIRTEVVTENNRVAQTLLAGLAT